MSSGRNWTRHRERVTMTRRGTEGATDDTSFMLPLVPKRTRRPIVSKADQRAEAERAMAEWEARRNGVGPSRKD